MRDLLEDGRIFRLFNVIDDFSRGAIDIQVDFSLPSERVIRELEQIISWRDNPDVICVTTAQNTLALRYRLVCKG